MVLFMAVTILGVRGFIHYLYYNSYGATEPRGWEERWLLVSAEPATQQQDPSSSAGQFTAPKSLAPLPSQSTQSPAGIK